MSGRVILKGATNISTVIRIIDSTDGTPETGVTSASGGLDLQYRREGAASTAITESDLTALTDAHSDGGMLHIGNGYYRLDVPDAAFASGADGVLIHGAVTGMVVIGTYHHLVDYNPQDATRLGLTALPNAAADAAGGLPISDAGGLDMDSIKTDTAAILVDTAEIGTAGAGLTNVPWNASWDAEVQSEVDDALVAQGLDHLVNVAVVGTDITDNSIIAQLVSSSATADWDSYVNTTDSLQAVRDHVGDGTNLTEAGGTGDHLTAVPWNAAWDAEVQSEVDDALVAQGLDHLVNVAVAGTDVTDNSIIAQIVSSSATADWDTFVNTDDSLQAISEGGGGGPTAAQIADAVWDEDIVAAHGTADTGGLLLSQLGRRSVTFNTDVVDGSIIGQIADDGTASFDRTTDSVQAIRDRGDAAWTTGSGTGLTALASGTAQGGTASTIQLASGETFANDELNGNTVKITSGTGAGQARVIYDYTGATDTASVTPNWTTTPDATSVYEVVEGSANVVAWLNTSPNALISGAVDADVSAIQTGVITAASIATDAIGSAELAASAANEIRDAILSDSTPFAGANIDAALSSLATQASVNTVDSNVDAILLDTAEIGAAGAGLTAIPWNAAWDAEVQSEVDDALVAQGLDHLVNVAVVGTDVTNNSIVAKLVSASATADWDDFVNTTDSLQAVRDHVGDGTNLTEAGGTGDHLTALATQASVNTVDSNVDAILLDTNELQTDWANGGRLDLLLDACSTHTADNVWTTTVTEGYAADGAEFTAEQALYMIWSCVSQFDVSGTTLTMRQLDGTTAAGTFTLDDASNPTSRVRAT